MTMQRYDLCCDEVGNWYIGKDSNGDYVEHLYAEQKIEALAQENTEIGLQLCVVEQERDVLKDKCAGLERERERDALRMELETIKSSPRPLWPDDDPMITRMSMERDSLKAERDELVKELARIEKGFSREAAHSEKLTAERDALQAKLVAAKSENKRLMGKWSDHKAELTEMHEQRKALQAKLAAAEAALRHTCKHLCQWKEACEVGCPVSAILAGHAPATPQYTPLEPEPWGGPNE